MIPATCYISVSIFGLDPERGLLQEGHSRYRDHHSPLGQDLAQACSRHCIHRRRNRSQKRPDNPRRNSHPGPGACSRSGVSIVSKPAQTIDMLVNLILTPVSITATLIPVPSTPSSRSLLTCVMTCGENRSAVAWRARAAASSWSSSVASSSAVQWTVCAGTLYLVTGQTLHSAISKLSR